jgi:hypothetical protein
MTKQFEIANTHSGLVLGVYEGETADDALDAMARDAGYQDYRDACSITLTKYTDEELDAEVDRCRAQMSVVEVK